MFRALLLDLDDTLFDRGAAFAAWADATARAQLGRPLTADELATLIALDGRGHAPRDGFAAAARARLGLAIHTRDLSAQVAAHAVPEPGARETLVALARTHRIGIVTNGASVGQRAKLARIGLADVAHTLFISAEVGAAKPAPAIFEQALRWTGSAPHEVLFVGDEPVIDLAPAARLGMATAWRARSTWPRELAPPTHRIARVADLAKVCAA